MPTFSRTGLPRPFGPGTITPPSFGVVPEKEAWNDYAAVDVKGKVVLLLPDLPASLGDDSKTAWTFDKKVKTAAEKGAVGLIEMDLSTPGARTGPRQRPGILRPGQTPAGFVVLRAGQDFLNDAFYIVGRSWRDLVSKTLRLKKSCTADLGVAVEMEAHYVSGERTAPNVIGVMPGTDPKLKGEALVIGGHLDHLGDGVCPDSKSGGGNRCSASSGPGKRRKKAAKRTSRRGKSESRNTKVERNPKAHRRSAALGRPSREARSGTDTRPLCRL